MRYTRIDLEGREGYFARISRRRLSEYIEVEILTPELRRTHHVLAASREDQWSMAQCLQETLDSVQGTRADIESYAAAIRLLAD